jgi:hypothetical protein
MLLSADLSPLEAAMRPLLLIIGTAAIVLASYSADARGMGGHSGGRAHFAGHRFGFHHFGFNRFGLNRRFNRFDGGWGWGGGYGDYGWGYGDTGYPYYAAAPNVVVMPQPTPSAAPSPQRAADRPPCHEVTPFGVTINRGMSCSQGSR